MGRRISVQRTHPCNDTPSTKKWNAKAGIKKKITFHSFRHSYEVSQLSLGTDIYTTPKMLMYPSLYERSGTWPPLWVYYRIYLGRHPREVSPVSVDSALESIDLMHFGWNIGKVFGKKHIHTAIFIKNVFAHALRDIEVSTIERKMSHTESECRIKLDGTI